MCDISVKIKEAKSKTDREKDDDAQNLKPKRLSFKDDVGELEGIILKDKSQIANRNPGYKPWQEEVNQQAPEFADNWQANTEEEDDQFARGDQERL